MKILNYSHINTNVDTLLDCMRLNLMLHEIITEIEAAPRGTKVKSEYGLDCKSVAIKQFKNDILTTRKNINYWINTVEGLERLEEHPEFLNKFHFSHYNKIF